MMNPATLRARLREVIQAPRAQLPPPLMAVEDGDAIVGPESAAETLGGSWRDASGGRSLVVVRRHAPETRYGHHCVGDFAERLSAAASSARYFGATAAQPPFVFFDLETTGLNGGAGTCAFLVGCARFEADGSFVTEQHVMVNAASERAMLRVVSDDLSRAGTLVTFNGKSFDAPLVETRYLFHRSESPCGRLPHLDMLHPARRFWGAADTGCSLSTLEETILGARRTADVPGFEIPARYFQFVRSGDARPLVGVLEHNRLDLLSLAGITARLLTLADHGADATSDAYEALALGRTYERAGLQSRAEHGYERAIALSGASGRLRLVKIEALRALAIEDRRRRHHDRSADRWRQVADVPGCPPQILREAAEALAIHHEHRVRDLEMARKFALKSLEVDRGVAWGDAVRHRLARIERKMVSERRPLFPSSPSQPASAVPPSEHRTSS